MISMKRLDPNFVDDDPTLGPVKINELYYIGDGILEWDDHFDESYDEVQW